MGWLSGWAKRINGTVVRPEGALTDYPVPVYIAEGADISLCPCESLIGWNRYGAADLSCMPAGDGTNHVAITGHAADAGGAYAIPSALKNWQVFRYLSVRARRSTAGVMQIWLFSGAKDYPPYVLYEVNITPTWRRHIIDLSAPLGVTGAFDIKNTTYIRFDVDGAGVVLSVDDIRLHCDLHCYGQCLPTFNDIRFTSADGETLMPHWIESITGLSPNQVAKVWMKCPTIGSTKTPIYAYYGNPEAEAVSDGAAVFSIFDDFSDNILSASWAKTESKNLTVSESAGVLALGGTINATGAWTDCYAELTQAMTASYAVGAKMKITGTGTGYVAFLRIWKDAANSVDCHAKAWTLPTSDDLLTYGVVQGGAYSKAVLDATALDAQYHGIEMGYDRATGTVKFYHDGVYVGTTTIANLANATTYVHLGCVARIANDDVSAKFDNFYVRTYVSPEPARPLFNFIATVSSIAAKEQYYRRLRNG